MGSEKSGERPSTLAADGADRGLVAAVDIGTLVAVHLHGDEMLIHNGRDFRIVVGLAVHHMAPVAPHGANVEQHGLILAPRDANASSPHSCQRMGWCMAERR